MSGVLESVGFALRRPKGERQISYPHEQRRHIPAERRQGFVQCRQVVKCRFVDSAGALIGDFDGALGIIRVL